MCIKIIHEYMYWDYTYLHMNYFHFQQHRFDPPLFGWNIAFRRKSHDKQSISQLINQMNIFNQQTMFAFKS